jgi:hypothetical protein
MITLRIEQAPPHDGKHLITLRLLVIGKAERKAEASIEFALSDREQEDLRWYLEDYLQKAGVTEPVVVEQVTGMIRQRGIELYQKVFTANTNTQALWFAVRDQLADLRIEISTSIAEAASVPWELMHDPELDSPIALRVKAFVRVQSDPNIGFVDVPPLDDRGRLRLLYIVCRPSGSRDVPLRALVNRILQDLGDDLDRFDITALRPPTFEQLQQELGRAKAEGKPYHIVHFDGHGVFADLCNTTLSDWIGSLSSVVLGGTKSGKHGYLLFEHPESEEKMRPVDGHALGKLLHDHGSPVLVLNACQSAMHEASAAPSADSSVHDEIRAIGSLSQAVIDQGVPAVLGMRYSVYVVTAAQYIGELYRALAQGQSFGEAASTGRKHLFHNPERWLGLQPRVLQDWCVPVVHEAMPISLLPTNKGDLKLDSGEERDPAQMSSVLRRYVPEGGFVGRDETLLALDRAFDQHRIVLLHAYAGQGKSSTSVEFARWYALTGGLGSPPIVLFSNFEQHLDLASLLNQVATAFRHKLEAENIHWHAVNESDKRTDIVKRLLRKIPVLWIWNNVETVAGFPTGALSQWTAAEQGELCDFLKQIAIDNRSQLKLLLTSRRDEQDWLRALPNRVKMPRMSGPDAARLAQQLGKKNKVTLSEVGDWQPLLDYCAGNPLTLRVLVGQALKMGLRGPTQLQSFVEAIRNGEQHIEDADASEGRDHSLGASLDYGFKHAFKDDELPVIALLHLFQGTVLTDILEMMGKQEGFAVPELHGWSKERINRLLHRATETGLIDHLWNDRFTIHPVLPWFLRQVFTKHYNGEEGRSLGEAALRAWVVATADRASFSHRRFHEGKKDVIVLLELDEMNILHARDIACGHQWWKSVTSAMQGLRCLYGYHGRSADWERLVREIVPDYCTATDDPVPGREESYSLIMEYRLSLAKKSRDTVSERNLFEKLLEFNRRQAAEALALPLEEALNPIQRMQIHLLAVSLANIGDRQRMDGDPDCISMFEEAASLFERIDRKVERADLACSIGSAFRDVPVIRNLERAAESYQSSLSLRASTDHIGQAESLRELGKVSHLRFNEAERLGEPKETCLMHANEALRLYHQSLAVCPLSAVNSLGPIHCHLGNLFAEMHCWDDARKHYEMSATYTETINRQGAGITRHNLAIMYLRASEEQHQHARGDFLCRAEAYAQAALRDFQHYQGCLADDETETQRLLGIIAKELEALPVS